MMLKVFQKTLKNRYFVLRHGESTANVQKLISSTYKVAVANHGLTLLGIDQAKKSAEMLFSLASQQQPNVNSMNNIVSTSATVTLKTDQDVIFYASDFARAYETAYHCRNSLKSIIERTSESGQRPSPAFYTTPYLRERFFGSFDGTSTDNYTKVWEQDTQNEISSSHFNSESISSVLSRVLTLIDEIENIYENKIIVLVSHGDVCQITQTSFMCLDGRQHRS